MLLLPCQEEHLLLLLLLLAMVLLLLNAHFVKTGYGDAPSALPETMVKTPTAGRAARGQVQKLTCAAAGL